MDRSRAWWEQCSSADYPKANFRSAFRMGRATFAMLCDALGATVAKEDTALHAAIPVRQRVAVCVCGGSPRGSRSALSSCSMGGSWSEAAAPGCRAKENATGMEENATEMEENATGMASDGELTATALGTEPGFNETNTALNLLM
jgi:hypothetical protein